MGLFSSNRGPGPHVPRVTKAPWWSAGAGTYRAHVDGIQLDDYPTRRQATRAARTEANRRNQNDRNGR